MVCGFFSTAPSRPQVKTDRERLLSNGSLARCSVSQAIEARLSKYKHLLSLLSYRARVLIINNLAAVCQ